MKMTTQGNRILVVDDDCRITEVVKSVLKSCGYDVKTENNSLSAIFAALEFKPNLVLLDVSMPDKDGGDVADALRASPATARVPVIFVTSLISEAELGGAAGFLGGEEYIAKPASRAVLADRVRERLLDPGRRGKSGLPNERRYTAAPSRRTTKGA